MWQFNYEAACLCHSFKGTAWKNHKYLAKKNGRYIYPGNNKNDRSPEEIAKNPGPIEYQDPGTVNENEKPISSRERAAMKRKQQRLERKAAREQAMTNSLRRNTVNRAKENGAAITERDRAWKAVVRRKETVKRAKDNAKEQAKQQDIWKRKKAYADRINASKIAERKARSHASFLRRTSKERAKANGAEVTKQQKEWQKTKKKVKRERAMKAAKRAWDKFSSMPFKWKK